MRRPKSVPAGIGARAVLRTRAGDEPRWLERRFASPVGAARRYILVLCALLPKLRLRFEVQPDAMIANGRERISTLEWFGAMPLRVSLS
jgi:hypothetical protein